VATGVLFLWTDGRDRHFADGGYRCAVADERVQRVGAVVSAAASSLRRVVVPRLERAQALLAADHDVWGWKPKGQGRRGV